MSQYEVWRRRRMDVTRLAGSFRSPKVGDITEAQTGQREGDDNYSYSGIFTDSSA